MSVKCINMNNYNHPFFNNRKLNNYNNSFLNNRNLNNKSLYNKNLNNKALNNKLLLNRINNNNIQKIYDNIHKFLKNIKIYVIKLYQKIINDINNNNKINIHYLVEYMHIYKLLNINNIDFDNYIQNYLNNLNKDELNEYNKCFNDFYNNNKYNYIKNNINLIKQIMNLKK